MSLNIAMIILLSSDFGFLIDYARELLDFLFKVSKTFMAYSMYLIIYTGYYIYVMTIFSMVPLIMGVHLNLKII